MNRSKRFEAVARRMAKARIKAVRKLSADYQRLIGSWIYRVPMAILVGFFILLGVMLLVALPLSAGVALGQGGRGRFVNGSIVGLMGAGIALGHGRWLMQELLASRSLAIASQLPMSDSAFLSNRLRRTIWASTACLTAAVAYFLGIAVGTRLPLAKSLVVVGLGVVEWMIVVSLAIILPAFWPALLRPQVLRMVISLGSISVFAGVVAGQMQLIRAETAVTWLLGIVPTGWPLLMAGYGVLGKSRAVWLFLPGVVALWVLAYLAMQRMRRRYQVTEINFGDGALALAVLQSEPVDSTELPTFVIEDTERTEIASEPDRLSDDELELVPQTRRNPWRLVKSWFVVERPEAEYVELTPALARDAIRSREFLASSHWSPAGWLESTFLNAVDERERLVAELMLGSRPTWSKRLMSSVTNALLILLVAWVSGFFVGPGASIFAVQMAMAALAGMLGGSWPAAVWKSKTGHSCPIAGLLPVSPHEVMKLSVKLGAVRGAFIAPFVFGMAATATHGMRGEWQLIKALTLAAKATLIFVALHQWAFILLLSTMSSRRLWRRVFDFSVMLVLMMGTVAAVVGLFLAGKSEARSTVAVLILFACGWMAQWWERRGLNRQPHDFITVSRPEVAQAQSSVEAVESGW